MISHERTIPGSVAPRKTVRTASDLSEHSPKVGPVATAVATRGRRSQTNVHMALVIAGV